MGGKNGKGATSALSPLVQSYSSEYNVNRPYSFLPREANVFTQAAMGPGGPIQPMGINEPRELDGRPDPRRSQFPVNWNLPIGQPGQEGLKLANFATLRAAADEYSVARACVNKRIHEITSLEWDIIPTQEADLDMHANVDKRSDFDKRRKQVKDFFKRPDSDRAKYPTFSMWLASLIEDIAVVDAVAIHLRPPRRPGSGPFGSDLASLDIVDGTTIRPLLDVYGATPSPPNVAYQQYMYGVPRVDMTSVITEADIDIMDGPIKEFKADQLLYLRYNPRNWTPYGFSWIEQSILPISIGLARQQWQWNYYQEGSIPGQFVVAGPDISTPQQIRQFQDALNSMAGDQAQKHKIIVLPPGSTSKDMKPINMADQFDEWIVSTVTMGFGLTPMDIGITPKVKQVPSTLDVGQLGGSADADRDRIEPVTNWLKDCIFDYVIQHIFKQDDMEFSWGLTERGETKDDLINQHILLLEHGYESIDEGRADLGKPPWGLPETGVPMAWTTTGPIPLSELTSETGEQVNPMPGQSNDLGARPTDDELTTPAHGKTPPPEKGPVNPPGQTPPKPGAVPVSADPKASRPN